MPAAIHTTRPRPAGGITKLTNCRLVRDSQLVYEDLWVSADTGVILRSQEAFYTHYVVPDHVIDLGGRIVAPGFLDVQLNGALGFDFSVLKDDMSDYVAEFRRVNKGLVKTGVTSYLPTLTSQRAVVYQKAVPYLGPSGKARRASDGSESLGAHCEGPFLSPTKNGIHNTEVLLDAPNGLADLEACYGANNLGSKPFPLPPIKMITAAPERGAMLSAIPALTSRGIVFSIGHSESTYEDAHAAVKAGATMITHLFNAMKPLHHRNPGVFGVLGQAESLPRPFFGVIADGEHLHPTTVKIAYNAYPEGCILVTDAMRLVGLLDGVYDWTNADRIVKKGSLLTLEGSNKIAGSAVTLIECVENFVNWTGASVPDAIKAVTATPARMLGMEKVKGCLDSDADADLCVLSESKGPNGEIKLVVDQVWKFGAKVYDIAEEKGHVTAAVENGHI